MRGHHRSAYRLTSVSLSLLLAFQAVAIAPAPALASPQIGDLPTPVDAPPLAEHREPGEQADLRTATSRTVVDEDGTSTAELFTAPIHYRDAEGDWQPIDTSLVEDGRGYAWRNAGNAFGVRFKEELGEDFLQFEAAGQSFTLTLEGANRRGANAVGGTGRLAYADVLPGVDLEYELLPDGVKETLVLADANAPTRYRFILRAVGGAELTAAARPDGSVEVFAPAIPGPVFAFAAPYALDAADDGELTPVAEPNASLDVRERGADLVVDLELDADWLRDEARRFPVRLDPTITIQPGAEDGSWPMTCDGCGAHTSERLYIGGADTNIWRALLQFELGAIPAGAPVTDASFELLYDGYCVAASAPEHCGGSGYELDLHRMTGAWTTSTHSDDLAFAATADASHTFTRTSGWMTWDLTNLTQAWVDGGQANHGFMLKRRDEALSNSGPVPPGRRYTADESLRPKLVVTYTSDAVTLAEPTTLHADGAELTWTPFTGPTGASFERYEVHRSASSNFSPDASTRLTTITDPALTSFHDTTARPEATFTYRVVANTSPSNAITVTLPADGRSSIFVQPGPADGKASWLYLWRDFAVCGNRGADETLWVGATEGAVHRPIVEFDLRDIPAGASIEEATLSLWHTTHFQETVTVDVHRLTRSWTEGEVSGCNGLGADWYETIGGSPWTSDGGDFDPEVAASVLATSGEAPSWDDFDVAGPVQRWVDGEAPNLGFLLKTRDESELPDRAFTYRSDDYAVSPTLRPKLAITYVDGSHAQAPSVAIGAPGDGSTVSGTVTIEAPAGDDRRVESVEFLLDGASLGSDTTDPFAVEWDTTTATNGTHTLTARAVDDAGNATTSAAVGVSVDNSAPPTTAVTSPAPDATISGSTTVSANAADDVGVALVEFFVDGVRFGEDTTAPYSATWDTLDPDLPAFDGVHSLTTRATDSSGQVTTSAAVEVSVENTPGTLYQGGIAPETAVPPTVTYDPEAASQDEHGIDVLVTNNTNATWRAGDVVLRSRWFGPNHSAATPDVIDGPNVSLGGQLRKDRSTTITLLVEPPALPDGVDRAEYRLQIDLYDTVGEAWFAERGNPPSEHPVIVNKQLSTKLGLERYYHYAGLEAGAGMGGLVNVANGNLSLRWTPWSAPGRGLSTVLDLTYNSLEDHSESPIGNNWSLALSSLTRFGNPLDVHPNNADTIAGRANRFIEFTDGDGSTHRFVGEQAADGTVYWTEPPGVHLYLREHSTTDPTRKWALTRPDRVTFFYDDDGYPTFVADRNGNELAFSLEETPPGEDPGGPDKRVTAVTDAAGLGAGGAPNRSFDIDYYSKEEAKKAHVRGKVRTITDHSGSVLAFDYYDDGNLRRIVQRGGTHAAGSFLPDRSFVFTYTTPSGDGPAIADPADRIDPDPKTNQSSRIFSVRDPRGTETTFSYFGPGSGQLRWKASGWTDRAGQTSALSYDLDNRITTLTAPETRVSKYAYDGDGKVVQITDPLDQVTAVTWSADFHVTQVDEPGAGLTEYDYNDNGYLTEQRVKHGVDGSGAPEFLITQLVYENLTVDGNDVDGKWQAGRTVPHLSQLLSKTDPNGTATPTAGDYEWTFDYDAVGNPTTVIDPEGHTGTNAYHADGTLDWTRDAKGHYVDFVTYDANGLPTEIHAGLSELGGTPLAITRFGHDDDGLLRWIQDPRHASDSGGDARQHRSYFDYDAFGRLGRQSAPKRSVPGSTEALLWSGATFDANDNLVSQVGPHAAVTYTPQLGASSTTAFDAMDRPTLATGPDTSADPAGERTALAYDAAGRLTSITEPEGVLSETIADDFVTRFAYDRLDRVVRQTRYEVDASGAVSAELVTHSCYDLAGDLVQVTTPRAELTTVDCASPVEPFSTTYAYDAAHRLTSVTDAEGHTTSRAYDANSNVVASTNADDDTTTHVFDQRNLPIQIVEPFSASRDLTTLIEYDPVGNRARLISPRAYDAAGGSAPFEAYVTAFAYDALDRMTRIDLPTAAGDPLGPTYLHRAYDPGGYLTSISLPTTQADPGLLTDAEQTVMTYFDPGWIATSDDPGNAAPEVHFDYTAEGWQSSRAPAAAGGLDGEQVMRWTYFADGMLRERKDQGGQGTTFEYDANNNLLSAVDSSGLTGPDHGPIEVQAGYDALNRLDQVQQREAGVTNWTVTSHAYDRNGNVAERIDNRIETPAGAEVEPGRTQTHTYDAADWLSIQLDDAGTPGSAADDRRITNGFTPTGWEAERTVAESDGAGDWTTEQVTAWSYFANGKLDTLTTSNGSGSVLASHDVGYLDDGVYVNGHRTSDTFKLVGPDAAAPCRTSTCTATYTYDPRDRLIEADDGHGALTAYDLDAAGNIDLETVTGSGAKTVDYTYDGMQLTSLVTGGVTQRYWYDELGNLDCVTTAAGSQADCALAAGGDAGSPQLLTHYAYDYLDRMTGYRSFATNGVTSTPDDTASYVYDALDRVVEQSESHDEGDPKTTLLAYLGLTTKVSGEDQEDAAGTPLTAKTYAYDAYGHRIAMSETPDGGTTADYTYGYDVHGSVSLLIGETGSATASYGYTPYGASDAELTAGDFDPADPTAEPAREDNPLNAFRYSAKRYDTGSGSIDMGARRFGPDTSRFLQRDVFHGALANLGLSADPLTTNRYSLAGGNPISFVEFDGHAVLLNGGGGGACYTCIGEPLTTADDYATREATGDAETATSAPETKDGGFDPLGAIGDVAAGIGEFATSDAARTVLDSCGLISVIGTACDVANAGSYALEGDLAGVGFSLAGILPGASEAVGGARLAARYGDEVLGAVAAGSRRTPDPMLFRRGREPESATALANQARDAQAHGLPHGVSVFSRMSRSDAVSAPRSLVEQYFPVHKTGQNPFHYTVELPRQITDEIANTFNSMFGR